ncbi:lactosylceramide 4-alpha-galactosyltransferase-like [Chironomus tepperi]|uniref:lactosylceramide 4-alpha-galactosyltransferase-like n=1 Tax=Chironomus tepperi TaxID=113505 RepID=UPI00391F0301
MFINLVGSLRKYLILLTLFTAFIYLCTHLAKNNPEIGLGLFKNDSAFLINNIMGDEAKLLSSNSSQIFFLETHLEGRRNLTNARQACSVEAAAKTNPDLQIYLLLATNETQMTLERSVLYDALAAYPNINIRYVNLLEYSRGTPLEQFMIEDKLNKSKYRIEHTSDVMRILTLYKYGGLYLDLDVLSIFPVRIINKKNFVCLEGHNHFSNAIIKLDLNEGKKLSAAYVE